MPVPDARADFAPTDMERPEGIIITFSAHAIQINGGASRFIRTFKYLAESESGFMWNLSKLPKHEPLYVYICIGNRIRYRCKFVSFEELNELYSQYSHRFTYTLRMTGPVITAPHRIEQKGFQGFRYTNKLF